MEFRVLEEKDRSQLEELVNLIETNLPNKEWWLPISNESRADFFNTEKTCFIGTFDGEKLVAACGLFFDETEYADVVEAIGKARGEEDFHMGNNAIKGAVAEIGRCMVRPEYRGKGLMYNINMKLVDVAKNKGKKYIVATAHPDNLPSNGSFIKMNMENKCTIRLWGSYLRNVYMMEL
ncbi:MAG: GNAT family N-acetyltransferase [Lachnospira sp.]